MWADLIPAPVHPPAVYQTDDWMLQTSFPALFFNISGEWTDSALNATTPVGLIWKVEPSMSTEVFYYATVSSNCTCFHFYLYNPPLIGVKVAYETIVIFLSLLQHFRHPLDQSSQAVETENVYHLFTHYNHSGIAGYLRFVQFCQSANISYAFVNANGRSRFSPSTAVCFPGECTNNLGMHCIHNYEVKVLLTVGEYQPSPSQNMSIDASFNSHGLLEVNITIEGSPGEYATV